VLAQRRQDVAQAVGGAVGGAIAAAIASRTGRGAVVGQTVVDASALPAAVANHATWPVKKIKPDTQVIVIPRSGISAAGIVHPKWGNLLYLNVGGERVIIEYLLLRGKRVRAFLEESGWPLAWGGEIAQIKRELEEAAAARRRNAGPQT
jgi:hypothetical protein